MTCALRCVALWGLLWVAALAGCAGPGVRVGPGSSRDIVTASDQTDADRRARTRMELAAAYYADGKNETALDEVKQALVAKPELVEAYNLRGLIYGSLGNDQLANESFHRALQISPRDGDTLNNYAWYQCQRRRYAEAEALFQQVIAMPQYQGIARTWTARGVCQSTAGQLEQAEASLAKSYELDPSSSVTAQNLAEVLYRRGDYQRARFYVRRVSAAGDASNPQTLWLLARIENKVGNRGAATDIGRQLRDRFPQSREALAFEKGQFDE